VGARSAFLAAPCWQFGPTDMRALALDVQDLRSERQAPDRTAQKSYREELERQMCETKARREREKKEIEAYELKVERKVQQALAEEAAARSGAGTAGAAHKGKENSAVQQDQQQAPQQGQPSRAHSAKALREQPVQEGSHDPPTHLDRQPSQTRHDRKPQAARSTHEPPHLEVHREGLPGLLEARADSEPSARSVAVTGRAAERQQHVSSSEEPTPPPADADLRTHLEYERQRVSSLL